MALTVVPSGPVELQSRHLSDWISAFVTYTEPRPSPEIFRRWTGLAAVAGALERRVWLQTNASELYPNLFLVLLGPPGTGKDQAISPMKELWAATGKLNVAPSSVTHKGMIDHLASDACHKQYIDPTGAWISYHSILLPAPELGVLLPAHDLGFLSTLNELYNCLNLYEERSRMAGEVLRIERPHLHLVAGTQPKYLGELLPEVAWGMGFTSRMVMVYSGRPERKSLFSVRPKQELLWKDLLHDLKLIADLRGPFTVTSAALSAIELWHTEGCEQDKPRHSKLIHYNSRRVMHVLKLSMALSASQSNELVLDLEHFQGALDLLLEAEALMPEIFKEISSGGQATDLEEAFHYLLDQQRKTHKPTPEHRLVHMLSGRVPAYQIDYLITTMIQAHMIRTVAGPDGCNFTTPGQRYFEPLALRPSE